MNGWMGMVDMDDSTKTNRTNLLLLKNQGIIDREPLSEISFATSSLLNRVIVKKPFVASAALVHHSRSNVISTLKTIKWQKWALKRLF